jgi:hypothetical protein
MSEALAVRPLPPDFPAIEPTAKRVNVRMAMAGIYLIQGYGSMYRCLVRAGFSRATARCYTANGLSEKRCLEEAKKWDDGADPAKMLEAARRRAFAVIDSTDPKTVPLKDAMKMLDTVEKYYGGHELTPSNALLTVADRLSNIVAMLTVARERGLPVPALPAAFVDAELVQPVATESVKAQPQDHSLQECVDKAR